jgi:hypothetical protein
MAFVAGTLGVVSGLHISGAIAGASKSFDPQNAGIAEAVIGAVLAAGTLAVYRQHARARTIGLGALLFAIVGFIVGITITTRGGNAFDIAYHATTLPVLVATAWLLRSPVSPPRDGTALVRPAAAEGLSHAAPPSRLSG